MSGYPGSEDTRGTLPPQGYGDTVPTARSSAPMHPPNGTLSSGSAGDIPVEQATTGSRERKRVSVACDSCRDRRVKCCQELPCKSCVNRGEADTCTRTRLGSLGPIPREAERAQSAAPEASFLLPASQGYYHSFAPSDRYAATNTGPVPHAGSFEFPGMQIQCGNGPHWGSFQGVVDTQIGRGAQYGGPPQHDGFLQYDSVGLGYIPGPPDDLQPFQYPNQGDLEYPPFWNSDGTFASQPDHTQDQSSFDNAFQPTGPANMRGRRGI